jgi:hypothetical protein
MEMTIRDVRDIKIMETLNKFPAVKDGVLRLCEIASADPTKPKTADDVEDIIVQDLRKLGVNVFEGWAECRMLEESRVVEQSQRVHKHGKKK